MTDTTLTVPEDERQGIVPADLIERAREYARSSRAPSTLKTYASVWRVFAGWCQMHALHPLPADPEILVAYIADQADRIRPLTLRKHLAAISQAHRLAGLPSPVGHEAVRLTMSGLCRVKGVATNPKKAVRVEHVRAMMAAMPDTLVGLRDQAVLLVGFVGALRRSEIVGLDVADVRYEPEGAVIIIRRGKRDQEAKGREIAIPRGRHETTCAVRALQAWVQAAGITDGPLFVRLDPGAPKDRLDGRGVAHIVQRAAARAGLDPKLFSGHSLRRGFATETARGGATEAEIARTTGHRSLLVLRSYVEAGTLFGSCAARVLDL